MNIFGIESHIIIYTHTQSKAAHPNKFTQTTTKITQQPTNPHYKQQITRTTQLKLAAVA